MPQTIETIKEARWRQGKRFVYLENITALLPGSETNLLICVGNENVIIEGITIEANVEKLSWEAFGGTQSTPGTGDESKAIARNSAAATTPGQDVTLDPTITNNGQSLSGSPINLVAQVFRNNSYYLNSDLITSDFVFMKDTCYLVKITNTSAAATDVQLSMNISRE